MKMRLMLAFAVAFALAAAGAAQDTGPTGQNGQTAAGQNAGGQSAGGPAGGFGQRGGRSGFGGMAMMGRGVVGPVTVVAADHFTVKTFLGDTYTIQFGSNTRFLKMPAGMRRGEGGGSGEAGAGSGGQSGGSQGGNWRRGMDNGGNPPQEIKATDIKVGDVIEARGDVDATAKSVGATTVALVDPERAQQIEEMEADFGKTWLMGNVTGIDGVKVTLVGALDHVPHTFAADENTTFRHRRDPITLADIQVGDIVRVEGAVKNGVFTAASVGDMGAAQPAGDRGAGSGQPPAPPQ